MIFLESVTQPRITCANPCAIEKKTATLVCESTGLPAPKYSWYYGSVSHRKRSLILFIPTKLQSIGRRVKTCKSKIIEE